MPHDTLERLYEGVKSWNLWRAADQALPIDLRKADLSGRDLSDADLNHAHLRSANLRGTILSHSQLHAARLSGADLSGATLDRADLSLADARGAYFMYASLREARMQRINLNGANLTGADLQEADLESTVLLETVLVDSNLFGARGLESCDQPGPSIVDCRTYLRSKGLPLDFLRRCGLPDELIESYSRLSGAAISCFLSHASADEVFARKLYSRLQERGVRCWFAPDDLPIGVKIRPAIDREIFHTDRFVVVLSASSIGSPWVEREVETAFERAMKQKVAFLVPIRLDDAVMNTDEAWAADLRRTMNIGDFRNWQDSAAFERALDRFVRDLARQN